MDFTITASFPGLRNDLAAAYTPGGAMLDLIDAVADAGRAELAEQQDLAVLPSLSRVRSSASVKVANVSAEETLTGILEIKVVLSDLPPALAYGQDFAGRHGVLAEFTRGWLDRVMSFLGADGNLDALTDALGVANLDGAALGYEFSLPVV